MKDPRTFIKECEGEAASGVCTATKEVDPKYEILAIIKKLGLLGKYPLVLSEKVKGYKMPVVCGMDTTPGKFYLVFGVPPEKVEEFYDERKVECIKKNSCPVKEV